MEDKYKSNKVKTRRGEKNYEKRLFATLLACAMTVSLVACGGSSSSSEKKEDTSDSKNRKLLQRKK